MSSTIVVCSVCGRGEEFPNQHRAKKEGWTNLHIDGVIGPADASEWTGRCPDHTDAD